MAAFGANGKKRSGASRAASCRTTSDGDTGAGFTFPVSVLLLEEIRTLTSQGDDTVGTMKAMLDPKVIAVVGASEEQGTVGRAIMDNLLRSPDRRIIPVNPGSRAIMGLESYPEIGAVPEHVDLALIATPAVTVPSIVEGCGKQGVDGVIIISAGFRETGEEGARLERLILEVKKEYGTRIIGPNCIGILRPSLNLNASFLAANPKTGNIAFLSQSGALAGAILDWATSAHIGFSVVASLGSMIDVDFGDWIDFLGSDYHTRSMILYMESIGKARKFMSAARGFARNKPILVVKPGIFRESAKAALSHTGAMAGDDAVYDAAFNRVGVVRVREVAEVFHAATVLDSKYLPTGNSLAIITNAGGFGVMATDALMDLGGRLAELSPESLDELNRSLPSFWSKANPIDILGDAGLERYEKAIGVCLNDRGVNGILVIYAPQAILKPELLADLIVDTAKRTSLPIITSFVGGDYVRGARETLLRNNVPAYVTPEDAVRTYLHMYRYKRNLELLYETPCDMPVDEAPPKYHLKALVNRLAREGRTLLTDEEAKGFLSNYGIPVTTATTVSSLEGAINAAKRTGYPVALKIVSKEISHKTDVGGVRLAIRSEDELREAYGQMLRDVKAKAPRASIQGVSVQRMLDKIDYEVIIGAKKDKDFGSVILFGMGGVGVEVLKDVAVALPPLNQSLARRLMEETKVYGMLQGYRGKQPADLQALEAILVNFSNLIVDFPEIAEMDINPVAIAGGLPWALDARIVIDTEPGDTSTPYPHLVISPYPTRYIMPWRLSDGTEVILRPIRPEDEPLEQELLSTLSPEATRTRFFSIIKDITHDMLTRFCNIDYDREMAIVAELKDENRKRIIGIARIIVEGDLKSGEWAVLVHDDYQGKGLGYKLVDLMIGIAQDKGLEEIYAIVLTENDKMLRVGRRLGFSAHWEPDGITRLRMSLT